MSSSEVEPAVVRKSPEMRAFAPERNAFSPLFPRFFLPAAHLITCEGIINLKTEKVRKISSVESGCKFSKGVPLIGIKMFTGTD